MNLKNCTKGSKVTLCLHKYIHFGPGYASPVSVSLACWLDSLQHQSCARQAATVTAYIELPSTQLKVYFAKHYFSKMFNPKSYMYKNICIFSFSFGKSSVAQWRSLNCAGASGLAANRQVPVRQMAALYILGLTYCNDDNYIIIQDHRRIKLCLICILSIS